MVRVYRLRVESLGFRGLRVECMGFRGLELSAWSLGLGVKGFRAQGFR